MFLARPNVAPCRPLPSGDSVPDGEAERTSAPSSCGRDSPSTLSPPMRSHSRRLTPSQSLVGWSSKENMDQPYEPKPLGDDSGDWGWFVTYDFTSADQTSQDLS